MYEYVCEDKDIEEYKNEMMHYFDSDEEKDDQVRSHTMVFVFN